MNCVGALAMKSPAQCVAPSASTTSSPPGCVPAVLLENAIKYGANGSLIRAEIAYSGKLATLVVENQSVENIDPVTCFDRGVRFTDKVEGGGFGLFLAKEVVLCHNGKIRCESANGMVRMIVELPLHKVISHVS